MFFTLFLRNNNIIFGVKPSRLYNLLKFIVYKVNIKDFDFRLEQIIFYIKNCQKLNQEYNHELVVIVKKLQYYDRQL